MNTATPRVLALHGVATNAAIWHELPDLLPGMEIVAPQRPCSGDLEVELAALVELARDSLVVGFSGGATLGLALASRVPLRGALLHEPAVGSLVPGLLAPVRAAFDRDGTAGFAAALYGPTWVAPAEVDDAVTARELTMFRAFEPQGPLPGQGPVVITYGEHSPAIRKQAAEALRDQLGWSIEELPGSGHDVVHQNLAGLAARLVRLGT
ncbi:MAG: alpha/beta hydrolase [Propionibacteriales bacterium]|nr:alpha/beta hydrolase [Propionibacteriales bacterium]